MSEQRKTGQAEVELDLKAEVLEPDKEVFLPGELGAVLELTVTRADGSIRERRTMKSKSFVRQFLDLLMIQGLQVLSMSPQRVMTTSNILFEISASELTFAVNALTGDTIFGIVVGTDNTPPTINDYHMVAKIAHGTGAGQIQYGNMAFGAPASDATSSHFTITRDFANASGGDITVNEIGVYVKACEANGLSPANDWNVTCFFMIIRDVILGGISVPNGETLTVNYRHMALV